MPQWLVRTSTWLGVRVQAGPPVDDAVALAVDRGEGDVLVERQLATPRSSAAHTRRRSSPRSSSRRSPARVSLLSSWASQASTRCTAPGASTGLPMLTMPSTRSGRRAARPRASMPPRLCPTIVTLRSRRVAIDSRRRSIRSAASPGAADVDVDLRAVGTEALVAQEDRHRLEGGVTGHEARHEQHRVVGRDLVAAGVGQRPRGTGGRCGTAGTAGRPRRPCSTRGRARARRPGRRIPGAAGTSRAVSSRW